MKAKYKIEIALGTILIGAIIGIVYFSTTTAAANLWTYEQKFNSLNTASVISQDGWGLTTGVGTGALVVETGAPYEGTKHLTITDDVFMRIYKDIPSVVSGTMYVSIKMANSIGWTRFYLGQEAVNGYAIDLTFNGSNSNIQSPYNGANIQAYTGGTWYRIGIQFETGAGGWGGLAADTYKINVNGGAWSSAMPFQGLAVTGIDRIKFESVVDIRGSNQAWLDYISPNYAGAPQALYVGYPSAQSGSANPTNFAYSTPFFSAINNNVESVNKYRVQLTLASDTGFTSPVWDSDSGNEGIIITKTSTLPTGRKFFSCAQNSSTNKIYCFGGADTTGSYINQIVEYNPATDMLTTKNATLPTGRHSFSCAENSFTNKIYCFGGWNNSTGLLNQIVEYNPATDMLTTKNATLPTTRYRLSCAQNSSTNKIYCFGGWGGGARLNQIVEYNPATDMLTTKNATLPTARDYLSCAENSFTNKIYCFGGDDPTGSYTNQIVEYNPATDMLTTKNATLPTARYRLSCAQNSSTNKIYCFGGNDITGSYINQIVEYNPAADTLTTKTATLPTARDALSCAENSSTNKIYCFGGENPGAPDTNQIVEYSTISGVSMTSTANTARSPDIFYGGLTLLQQGTNYIWRIKFYGTSWGPWSTESATIGMTTGALTARFYLGAGDGRIGLSCLGTWADCIAANTGDLVSPADSATAMIYEVSPGGYNQRSLLPVNTSAIPAVSTITMASLNFWPTGKNAGGGANDFVALVQTTQVDETTFAGSAYSQFGSTKGSADITITSITANQYNSITLNATGLTWIKTSGQASSCGVNTGWTCLGARSGYDLNNSAPGTTAYYIHPIYFSEQTGISNDPYLSVTYTMTAPPPIGNIIFFGGD